MAKESSLKGSERKNHKYISREWKNGKWKYVYKTDEVNSDNAASEAQSESRASGKWTGKTASWVTSYNEMKNRYIGTVSPSSTVSQAKNSKSASAGRAAVSKLVKTDNPQPMIKAKTTTIDKSDAKYTETTEKVKKELAENNEKTEKYYKEQFETEKNKYKEKLLSGLTSQFGSDIPDSERDRIDKRVEEYSKTLWDDVYKPMMERVVKDNEHSTDQLMRTLKKIYEK